MRRANIDRTRLKELHEKKRVCQKYKKELIDFLQEQKELLIKREIHQYDYNQVISKKYDGKTIPEWIEYYDWYEEECNLRISAEKKSITKKKVVASLYAFILLSVLFVFIFYISPNLVGFVINNLNSQQTVSYTQNLSLFFNQSGQYTWIPNNSGSLISASISGIIKENDPNTSSVKIYLNNLLLFDSSNKNFIQNLQSQNSGSPSGNILTGFTISDLSSQDNQTTSDNQNLSINSNQSNIQQGALQNETSPSQGGPPIENLTFNNETNTNQTNQSVPSEQNNTNTSSPYSPTSNQTSLQTIILPFSNMCVETCNIANLSLNLSTYNIRIELNNAEVSIDNITYSILSTLSSNITIQNVSNQTIENTTVSNQTDIQLSAEINKPVKWQRILDANQSGNYSLTIPNISQNINLQDLHSAKQLKFDIKKGRREAVDFNNDQANSKINLTYETPAPTLSETDRDQFHKEVVVSGPDSIHYQNVTTYVNISSNISLSDQSRIKLYLLINGTQQEFPFKALDTNGDGFIDQIEWITPHLSNETFEIIIISKAWHLDSNRNFIEDIYDDVKALDNIWSPTINNGDYVRVTFEQNLTNKNDITLYPRIISGNPIINVYENNQSVLIAQFKNLNNNSYNKIYLTNLSNTQNVFDLQIQGGSVQFDHIIDPAYLSSALVQQGNVAAVVNLTNITLPLTVNTSNTFYLLSTRASGGSTPDILHVNGNITNSTTLSLYKSSTTSTSIEWQTVSSSNFNTQSGFLAMASATASSVVSLPNPINTSSSFAIVYGTMSATAANLVRDIWMVEIQNKTQINITRGITGTQANVSWQVVDFNNAIVQNGTVATSSGLTTVALGTAINTSNSFLIFSKYSVPSTGDATNLSIQGWMNATQINFYRNGTGNAPVTRVAWFVVSQPSLNVQSGNTVITGSAAPVTANIVAVNRSRTFVIASYDYRTASTTWANVYPTWNLTNGTQLVFQKGGATGNTNITWFAVEMKDVRDIVPPIPNIIAPINNTFTNSATQSFNATATDDIALANMTFFLWNSTNSLINQTNQSKTGASSSMNLSVTLPYQGVFTWNYQACDTSGNCAFNNTNYTITYDNVAPNIQFVSPTETNNTNISRNNILVNVTASDSLSGLKNITIFLYNSSLTLINSSNTSTSPNYANFTGLSNGIYYFNATAFDNAGNSNITNTTTVNISITSTKPTIPFVTSISAQSPNEDSFIPITFYFTANDAGGTASLNDTTAMANFTMAGQTTRQNNSCTKVGNIDANDANYSCTINLWYFDASGTWNVSVSVNDTLNNQAVNISQTFTYNQLSAFTISPSALAWNVLTPGATNKTASNDPILLNNTGNKPITSGNIQINATNLIGETDGTKAIYANNISMSIFTGGSPPAECNTSATNLNNSVFTSISGSILSIGNHSINNGVAGQEQLYACIKVVGSELTSQAYSTANAGAWTIKILVVIFSVGDVRKKLRKKNKKIANDEIVKAISILSEKIKGRYITANDEKLSEAIELLIKEIQNKYQLSEQDVEQIFGYKKIEFLPIEIFSNDIGVLEATCKYMKENNGMRYSEISRVLNRDQRTIWVAYHNAISKISKSIIITESKMSIPINALSNNKLTLLESIIIYCKENNGMRYSEISRVLNRDQRNIRSTYLKAMKKHQGNV